MASCCNAVRPPTWEDLLNRSKSGNRNVKDSAFVNQSDDEIAGYARSGKGSQGFVANQET